jgi:hypothetical protein
VMYRARGQHLESEFYANRTNVPDARVDPSAIVDDDFERFLSALHTHDDHSEYYVPSRMHSGIPASSPSASSHTAHIRKFIHRRCQVRIVWSREPQEFVPMEEHEGHTNTDGSSSARTQQDSQVLYLVVWPQYAALLDDPSEERPCAFRVRIVSSGGASTTSQADSSDDAHSIASSGQSTTTHNGSDFVMPLPAPHPRERERERRMAAGGGGQGHHAGQQGNAGVSHPLGSDNRSSISLAVAPSSFYSHQQQQQSGSSKFWQRKSKHHRHGAADLHAAQADAHLNALLPQDALSTSSSILGITAPEISLFPGPLPLDGLDSSAAFDAHSLCVFLQQVSSSWLAYHSELRQARLRGVSPRPLPEYEQRRLAIQEIIEKCAQETNQWKTTEEATMRPRSHFVETLFGTA